MPSRVEGCIFVMDDEEKQRIPLVFKLAANELAKQFYKVVSDHWEHGPAGSDTLGELDVRVFRDEDTLNPTYYSIIRRDGVMYRKEFHGQKAIWPIYKGEKREAAPAEKRALRRSTVSRLKAAQRREHDTSVHERNVSLGVQSAFVERAELLDDYKIADYEFMNEPTIQNAMRLKALRTQLDQAELKIVAAAISEQAVKDLRLVS